jgi:hypothetical protein
VSRGGSRARLAGIAFFLTAGLLGGVGLARPAVAQSAPHPPFVILAVPGLLWSDVETMPHLAALAAQSSVAEMSVKTSGSVTRCAAGVLAVSAGNRTRAPVADCPLKLPYPRALAYANRHSQYDARLGGLGTTLQANGIRTVTVGTVAEPMVANESRQVDVITPTIAKGIAQGGVVAILDPQLYDVVETQRTAARAAVDSTVAEVDRDLPPDATLMVAGISDLATGASQLHALVLHGPGWPHTELRSSAAGRAPYVQLIDVAPTILTAEGLGVPSYMVGRPMQRSGEHPPAISGYVDDNRHAVLQRTLGQHVFFTLGIAAILMMLLAVAAGRRAHRIAHGLALVIAPAPAMIFVANAFPWWRWNQIGYGAIVIVGCLVIAAATTPVRRRYRTGALIVIPIISVAVLTLDQLTGATLQLSAPLGDSPIVAGRFSGMGNIDFTILATSALLIAGIVGGLMRSRKAAVLAAGSICLLAIVVDGAPQLGNDIGGVLALVPASLVLLALVAEVTLTKLRVVAAVATTIVVAVGLALIDYARPATSQTHVGRFVGQVLHGGADTEIHRKLDAALGTFGLTIGTFVAGFAIVLGFIARHRIREALDQVPGAAAAAVSAGVVAMLGVALNDSGIVIAAMAAIIGMSAFYGGGLGPISGYRGAARRSTRRGRMPPGDRVPRDSLAR